MIAQTLTYHVVKPGFPSQFLNSLQSTVQRCLCVGIQIDIKIVSHQIGNDFGIDTGSALAALTKVLEPVNVEAVKPCVTWCSTGRRLSIFPW
jgi:hypothetical protein